MTLDAAAIANSNNSKIHYAATAKAWDAHDAYLFDIDGTLLRAMGGVHNDAFADSVRQVTGHEISLEGVLVHGNTDSRILAQAFEHAGIARTLWQPQQQQIHDRLCALVSERRDQIKIEVMPGVRDSLDHLRSLGRVLGTATGNLEVVGWLKIELAGLRDYFTFGGFSDRHEDRAAMIQAAALLARAQAGTGASVCVVGDTPSDISAARANDLPVIAVATGTYSLEELLDHQPDIATPTMQALLESNT